MFDINNLSDTQLVSNIKNKTEYTGYCVDELYRRHGGIISSVYHNYSHVMSGSGVNSITLGQKFGDDKHLVWEAAKSFDLNKNTKYSTWLYHMTRYLCLNSLKTVGKETAYDPEIINSLIENTEGSVPEEADEENLLIYAKEFIHNIELPHVKQLMTMRYLHNRPDGKKYTWREISEAINYTPQHIYNLHNSCLEKLREYVLSKQSLQVEL